MDPVEAWRGEGTLVTDSEGKRQLWQEPGGAIADSLGPVTVGEEHEWIQSVDDLVLVVGEWIVCATKKDGPIAYADIHPLLRARLYQLLPSVVMVTDDDEISFVLS